MSFSDFLADMKRYDENAAVIFDRDEPIGQATDLVIPRRRWFRRRNKRKLSPLRAKCAIAPIEQ